MAASLKVVINELADSYTSRRVGVKFIKNYGALGQLTMQIDNGAPVDLFISVVRGRRHAGLRRSASS
ncbi:molybdate ABC transporter substrate-binding protein [Oryzomonas rubra]|uniref:molybdate ABC transporter substrate-binding protein n=1 Tax=Oryzomonas rubra TaxID=2509454 RepID=UPI0030842201